MPTPPGTLITPAQLTRFNVPSSFVAQFNPRSFEVQIAVGGTLGTMAVQWQLLGDAALSSLLYSSAGLSWQTTIDDVFADITFAAGTYTVGDTWFVDTGGNVTPQGSAPNLVTASLFDLRQNACTAVTMEAMQLMRDAVTPPLLTWGDDARTHAAAWVYAILKRGRGATPVDMGVGDDQIFIGEKLAREFFADIGKRGLPDSMTDSSVTSDGPLIAAYPYGDSKRGW